MPADPAVTSGMPTCEGAPVSVVDGLALLPLPGMLHLLIDGQLRGADCVWCCESLSADAAFDFGARTETIGGVSHSQWFPRACRACVGRQARKAVVAHRGTCCQCLDDPALCADRDALQRLALVAR